MQCQDALDLTSTQRLVYFQQHQNARNYYYLFIHIIITLIIVPLSSVSVCVGATCGSICCTASCWCISTRVLSRRGALPDKIQDKNVWQFGWFFFKPPYRPSSRSTTQYWPLLMIPTDKHFSTAPRTRHGTAWHREFGRDEPLADCTADAYGFTFSYDHQRES